jgi:hypothetical protein
MCLNLLLGLGTERLLPRALVDEYDLDEEGTFVPRVWLTDGGASSGQEPGIEIFSPGIFVSLLDAGDWSFRGFEFGLGPALMDVSLALRRLSFELDNVVTSSTFSVLRVLSFEPDESMLSSTPLALRVLCFELDGVASSSAPLALRVLSFELDGVKFSSAPSLLVREEASSDFVLLALGGATLFVFAYDFGGDADAKEDCADLGRTTGVAKLSSLLGWPRDWSDLDRLALGCVAGAVRFDVLLDDSFGAELVFGGGSSSGLASARLSLLRDLLVEVLAAVLSLSGFKLSFFSLATDFATMCAGWERLGLPIDLVSLAGCDSESPRLLAAATLLALPISRSLVTSTQAARYLPTLCDKTASSRLGTSDIDEMASSICENSFFDSS